jgi:hypothetical protein
VRVLFGLALFAGAFGWVFWLVYCRCFLGEAAEPLPGLFVSARALRATTRNVIQGLQPPPRQSLPTVEDLRRWFDLQNGESARDGGVRSLFAVRAVRTAAWRVGAFGRRLFWYAALTGLLVFWGAALAAGLGMAVMSWTAARFARREE